MAVDAELLKSWIGRQETRHDTITVVPPAALAATLDHAEGLPVAGDVLPPLWHWLYFLPIARQGELGPDGHPRRGSFLPPVPLPRRMWAGARLTFHRELRIGEAIQRRSTIADVSTKDGRSGTLVFVMVRHEISSAGSVAITEEHDIVYRDAARPGDPAPPGHPAPEASVWQRDIVPDPVLLFRYSALTFNGHRIHYDRTYVTQEEGYPGLIVHGPLIATFLVDLVRHNTDRRLAAFRFRAIRPLFDTAPFSTHAGASSASGKIALWARDPSGFVAMEAEAELVPPGAGVS